MLRTFSLLWTLLVLSAAIFTTACTKDELAFGHDYLNKSDFVRAFIDSSTTVSTTTKLDNKLRSTYIMYMVGQTSVDGFSTQSKASFMSRFYFKDLTVNFKDKDIQLEGIELEMVPLRQFLGDTTAHQIFEIQELTDTLKREIVADYFDKGIRPTTLISNAKLLGTKGFIASTSDSTNFKFKFPAERAKNLFDSICNFYSQDNSLFYNDSALNSVFKGLYIEPLESAAIMNYRVRIVIKTNKGEALLFPAKNAYDQTTDSKGNPIPEKELDLYVQALTIFDHKYINEIQSQLNKPSPTAFVSGFMGLKTQLQFNDFDRWKDSVVVFNAVNLHVPIEQINKKEYVEMHNKTLRLNIYNATNKYSFPFTPSTADSVMYNFNITPFMTALRRNAEQASDYTFEIVMPENNRYGNAFKIDATNDKIKLVLRYSR
ncbi:MAG: DUF4270 domain-containing protein [Bacteroidetes bacterium]|nr:DUF4270 domain-containing protein [Bacteroidota bacterium]